MAAPKGKLRLEVRSVYIPYIHSIETDKLQSELRVDYDFLWKASEEELERFRENPLEYKPDFTPSVVLQNGWELTVENVKFANGNEYEIEPNGKNKMRIKVYGTFIQNFDLREFPFDEQVLEINLTLAFMSADDIFFSEEEGNTGNTTCVLTDFTSLPDWHLVRAGTHPYVKDNFWYLKTSIYVSLLPTGLITCSSLTYYATDPSAADVRLSVLGTVLLTLAALQFAMTTYLPMTPDLTFADEYITASFVVTFGVLVITSLVAKFDTEGYIGNIEEVDDMSFVGVTAVMIILQVYYICRGYYLYRQDLDTRKRDEDGDISRFSGQNEDVTSKGFVDILAKPGARKPWFAHSQRHLATQTTKRRRSAAAAVQPLPQVVRGAQ
ncbi:unnamed protein product [Pedinophyceae sp. YPF-701]|nr:unnamed protein product [Pedinophyceae sp. YPF-701]